MSSIHVHYGMQALHQFKATQGSLPRPWNTEDAQVMVTLANQIATQVS